MQATGRNRGNITITPPLDYKARHVALRPFEFEILTDNGLVFNYSGLSEVSVEKILRTHFKSSGFKSLKLRLRKLVDNIYTKGQESCDCKKEDEFFSKQMRIATKYAGEFSPLDLSAYREHEGFMALKKACDD